MIGYAVFVALDGSRVRREVVMPFPPQWTLAEWSNDDPIDWTGQEPPRSSSVRLRTFQKVRLMSESHFWIEYREMP